MNFKKGTYIIDRQRWAKTITGKKFKYTFTTIILLADDWNGKSAIPYINYWSINYKPRTKKFFNLNSICAHHNDNNGGYLILEGNWQIAPKIICKLCENDVS